MAFCKRCCCLNSSNCAKCTKRSFVLSSTLPFLVYLSLTIGSSFAALSFFPNHFNIVSNNLDYYTVISTLCFFSLLFFIGTSSCISMRAHRCGICPCVYSFFHILAHLMFGILFFIQIVLVTNIDVGSLLESCITSTFSYTQETCCNKNMGARICYPFWEACNALPFNNNTSSTSTFETTVQKQLLNWQVLILGCTLFVSLLLLTVGVSAGRLGCMISCGEPVDNEVVVMGEVMYVIDAFIEKRDGKKCLQHQLKFAGDKMYNVDAWPRKG